MLKLCRKDKVLTFRIEFMTQCYEGGHTHQFGDIYRRAEEAGRTLEIFHSKDVDGNLPF